FENVARENVETTIVLNEIMDVLDSFIETWKPQGMAHNDFYDDQLIVTPDGRMALVDFEEAGPGDPLLDVGNFLAHLRWTTRFGSSEAAEHCAEYRRLFRDKALERFGWRSRDLDLREAMCLFRDCTNMVRQPREDWEYRLREGLLLVQETLG
ncbi:MAG: phosphotransferase, partial [Chloroflexota bacterium]|nr:phosphotransferase [Chloroflexota bacterium]